MGGGWWNLVSKLSEVRFLALVDQYVNEKWVHNELGVTFFYLVAEFLLLSDRAVTYYSLTVHSTNK